MKLKDFIFRIYDEKFVGCSDKLCKCHQTKFIYGDEAKTRLSEFDENTIINLCTNYKDINGEKVYEGDIVKVKAPNYEELVIIDWRDSENKFVALKGKWKYVYDFHETLCGEFDIDKCEYLNTFEVVGNIYENEDLLKE